MEEFLPYPRKDVERLFSRLKEDPVTGCFVHQGARNPSGHVRVCIGSKNYYAHIVMYCVANKCCIIPGYVIRHKVCSNGACCNPAHLVLGTVGDNNKDRVESGRSTKVWKRKGLRLTDKIVLDIKLAIRYGHSNNTIYGNFPGLTYHQLYHIRKGSRHGHVKLGA
jgi:hypothetical protein